MKATEARLPGSTVLVIGAAGLVGSHVVRAFDRERVIRTHYRRRLADSIELDATRAGAVRALVRNVRPDVIVVAAAEPWVDLCERDPVGTRRINVDVSENATAAAREHGALLVVFSSEYVFDGTSGPYSEGAEVAPLNEYGRQKVATEGIARSIPRHLVCRTSGVFGWDSARKNFVCQLLDHLRAGRSFRVPDDQVITPTYAPDLAEAVVRLVRSDIHGTVHVVGPRIMERAEFAEIAATAFQLPSHLIDARASTKMGYIAQRPLGAGLTDTKLRSLFGHSLRAPNAALAEMRATEPS